MKKIGILLITLLLVCGCGKKNDKGVEEPKTIDFEAKREELNNKLLEYGKLVYENDTWIYGDIEKGVYFMTLKEMSERNKYDISMFVNPETNKACDVEMTKIEFYIDGREGNKNTYHYNSVLDNQIVNLYRRE